MFNHSYHKILTIHEIVTADDVLESICDCMLNGCIYRCPFDLYRRIFAEVSKRQEINPISKLDQWGKVVVRLILHIPKLILDG